MSVALAVNCSMTLTSSKVNQQSSPGTVSVTPASAKNSAGVASVATTAGGVAIPLGGLSTLGYAQFTNLDATNYVQLMTAVSGTVFGKLLPGETAVFRFDPTITAPAWIAHTGACQVSFLIVDGT